MGQYQEIFEPLRIEPFSLWIGLLLIASICGDVYLWRKKREWFGALASLGLLVLFLTGGSLEVFVYIGFGLAFIVSCLRFFYDKERSKGERIIGIAIWPVMALVWVYIFSRLGPRINQITVATHAITQKWADGSVSIPKKGIWATVIHYQPQDYNEWILRSPGPNPKQIRLQGSEDFINDKKQRLTGDDVGRKICSWAGIKPKRKIITDETPTVHIGFE